MQPEEPRTWIQRMGEHLCRADTLTPELVEGVLEAAGEMKCVRLKVLLARCYELIAINQDDGVKTFPSKGFLDEILEALQ